METLAAFLASQPLLALFLVIGLGYALGEVAWAACRSAWVPSCSSG